MCKTFFKKLTVIKDDECDGCILRSLEFEKPAARFCLTVPQWKNLNYTQLTGGWLLHWATVEVYDVIATFPGSTYKIKNQFFPYPIKTIQTTLMETNQTPFPVQMTQNGLN